MTSEVTQAALEPCPNPWCNSRKTVDCEIRAAEAPILMPSRSSAEWAVACPVCPLQTPYFDTEVEATAAWNTRLTAQSGEQQSCEPIATVEMIETVTGDFHTEPGEPIWRVMVGEYCADFDFEQAARNFASAINLAAQSGEGRSGAGPHNVDANGKPTDDSDPWFQLGWYKDRLERAETERDIWKERAMSLRIASRKAGLLQTALEDICDPIAALRRYADERGRQLDGAVAFQLANDPNHIKGIARAALRATDDAGGA